MNLIFVDLFDKKRQIEDSVMMPNKLKAYWRATLSIFLFAILFQQTNEKMKEDFVHLAMQFVFAVALRYFDEPFWSSKKISPHLTPGIPFPSTHLFFLPILFFCLCIFVSFACIQCSCIWLQKYIHRNLLILVHLHKWSTITMLAIIFPPHSQI